VNKFIIQKLVENVQFLYQEFVKSVDDGSHDTDTMRFDRVEHLIYSNGFDLLSLSCDFDEDLGVDVVAVL
jgi:hypothetical protein